MQVKIQICKTGFRAPRQTVPLVPTSPLGHKKRKACFMGPTNPIFPNWENFFPSLLKSCKNQPFFGQILQKFSWKFLKSNWEYFFFKFFSKKHQILGDIFVYFRGVIFTTRKTKNIFKNVLTDPTWKVRPPIKQGFFFFMAWEPLACSYKHSWEWDCRDVHANYAVGL